MKINKVTITGADDKTSHLELVRLSKKYPFVEWGILFSASKVGANRYPSIRWIEKLREVKTEFDKDAEPGKKMYLSGHFCGKYSRDVMSGTFSEIDFYKGMFKRFQLNFNFKAAPYKKDLLLDGMKNRYDETIFILQYNKSNASDIDEIIKDYGASNLHCLYDASGGRGKVISEIKEALPVYTGYSGGLNLENVEGVCKIITEHENPVHCWIDMESGVRTNDELDLGKVEKVLETCSKFIK